MESEMEMEPVLADEVSDPELEVTQSAACDSDRSASPHHNLLSRLHKLKPEAFVVEVDARKGITSAQELPNFESVLQRVRTLSRQESQLADASVSRLANDPAVLPRLVRFNSKERIIRGMRGREGSLDDVELEASIEEPEPTWDAPLGGFTWVSYQTTNPKQIASLGRECRLHPLTIDDITHDAYEKAEQFQRRGYAYCMIESEDSQGNNAHIHICLFRRWVLTIHNCPSTAIQQALYRLEDEFSFQSQPDIDLQSGRRMLVHTSWIPYILADLDVHWMMEMAQMLVQEAQETEQLMRTTSMKEHPDVLRRISLGCSRISCQLLRNFSKQRMLMSLSAPASDSFIAAQMKVYLRSVDDHIHCCGQRLNFAHDVLDQANNNYMASIQLQEAKLANRMNMLLSRLTILTVIAVPINTCTGLFGMNVEVPMMNVVGLAPWCGNTFTCIVFCTFVFLVLYRLDQQQQQR